MLLRLAFSLLSGYFCPGRSLQWMLTADQRRLPRQLCGQSDRRATIAQSCCTSPSELCVSLVAARSEPGSTGVGNQVRRRREGVQVRHARRCGSRRGGECSCAPTYQAQVWSARDHRPIRKTFPTVAGALAWRQETQVALRRGTLRAPTATTLAEAADAWLAGAEAGIIRTRSDDPYKPSALRSYRHALQSKLLPELGRLRLSAIKRNDLQDLVDRMVAAGRSPSTVRNTILPLRAIYRRAIDRDQLAVNPTLKLLLPAVRGKREPVARADEAVTLLAVLPPEDRALSGQPPSTAAYAAESCKRSNGPTSTSTTISSTSNAPGITRPVSSHQGAALAIGASQSPMRYANTSSPTTCAKGAASKASSSRIATVAHSTQKSFSPERETHGKPQSRNQSLYMSAATPTPPS